VERDEDGLAPFLGTLWIGSHAVKCIVAVKDGNDPAAIAADCGLIPYTVSRRIFAAELTADQVAELRTLTTVDFIELDGLDYPA
jgi:hypothetical protein